MKKFISFLLCVMSIIGVFALSACSLPIDRESIVNDGNNEISARLPDNDEIDSPSDDATEPNVGDVLDEAKPNDVIMSESNAVGATVDVSTDCITDDDDKSIENTPTIQPDENITQTPADSDESVDDDVPPTESGVSVEMPQVFDLQELAQFNLYADVGDEYQVVMQPLKQVAEYIIADLTENNVIKVPGDAVMTSIRYAYGRSIYIFFRQIPKIYDTDADSDFLYINSSIVLDHFVGTNNDWLKYVEFLQAERGCEGMEKYAELVLPYAEQMASIIKAQYEDYKVNVGFGEVRYARNDNQIVLKADSSLSETYKKIVANLNSIIEANDLPRITNQDIKITFGGNIYNQVVYDRISLNVNLQNYSYCFSANFNSDGEFTEEWLNYFKNTLRTGYSSPMEAFYVPGNDEYAEFFEKMQIENINFRYFYTGMGENTFLYF